MNENPRAFTKFSQRVQREKAKNDEKISHFSGKESLRKNHKQEPKLSFLVKALYTFAYGLDAYRDDICGKETIGVCPRLQKSFNHSTFFVII